MRKKIQNKLSSACSSMRCLTLTPRRCVLTIGLLIIIIGLMQMRFVINARTNINNLNQVIQSIKLNSPNKLNSVKARNLPTVEIKAKSSARSSTENNDENRTANINEVNHSDNSSAVDRISSILHQTWIGETIPSTYVPYVKSWIEHKPKLSYYYWTDSDSVKFVAKHYPNLLKMFSGYKAHLNRADAIRYMLLHHYGGIYADMDMMRLKDLAPLLSNTSALCYLSQERYEITRLFWGLNSSVMNAIMLSAPGHKFMQYVVESLPKYAKHSPNVMESTGPFFLQNVYNEFMNSPPCNLSNPMCYCVVADPYTFMPQIDPIRIPLFRARCSNLAIIKPNQRTACQMLDKLKWRNALNQVSQHSFTHHGFLHYGFENQKIKFSSVASIHSVRPDLLRFGKDFH